MYIQTINRAKLLAFNSGSGSRNIRKAEAGWVGSVGRGQIEEAVQATQQQNDKDLD